MKKLGYRVEHNHIVYFDWQTRTYFKGTRESLQFQEDVLKELGHDKADSYVITERRNDSSEHPINSDYPASPFAAYIEISSQCNMQCKHCFKSHVPYSEIVSYDKIMEIIDELDNMGVFELRFVGYEPTTNPNLFDIASYAKQKGFYLVLNTNGFFLDEKQNRVVNFGFDEFLVSIDGDREYHDHLRGLGSYDRAIALIEKLGRAQIRTKINMTVNKSNIRHIEHLAFISNENNVNLNIIPMRMIGNGERAMGSSDALKSVDMKAIAMKVKEVRQKYKGIVIYLTYHDYLEDEDVQTVRYHKPSYAFPCPAANNINIARNGQVYPCDLMSELGDEFCLGNILESSIKEMWRYSKRIEHYRSLEKTAHCLQCDKYGIKCSGGCFIERYLYNGRKFIDPLCYTEFASNLPKDEDDRGSFYDEDYYLNGKSTGKSLYTNYHYIPERSNQDALAVQKYLRAFRPESVIDFGSGMGYLVHSLLENGINAFGVEISTYARNNSMHKERIYDNLLKVNSDDISLLVALSVFEHLTVNEVLSVVEFSCQNKLDILFTVPVSQHEGGNYLNSIFEEDKSHILRRPSAWWVSVIEKNGYKCTVEREGELLHGKDGMILVYSCLGF